MNPIVAAVCVLFIAVPSLAQGSRVEIFVGGGIAFTGPNVHATIDEEGGITVSESGLPIVPPGRLTIRSERFEIKPSEARAIMRLALAATDFENGCNTVADGTSARVVVHDGNSEIERRCFNAATWPAGPRTRALLDRVNKNIPKAWQIR